MDHLVISDQFDVDRMIEIDAHARREQKQMKPDPELRPCSDWDMKLLTQLADSVGIEAFSFQLHAAQEDIGLYKPFSTPDPMSFKPPVLVVTFAGSHTGFSIWEHPMLDLIPSTWMAGRYFGYQDCCNFTFHHRMYSMKQGNFKNMEQDEVVGRSKGYPCLVCEKHARMTIEEVEAIVMKDRICSVGLHAPPLNYLTQELEYLLALQQGKLTHPVKDLDESL